MEPRQEYPKKIYHADGRTQRVLSIDEHALYPPEAGWAESPAGPFLQPAEMTQHMLIPTEPTGEGDALPEAPPEDTGRASPSPPRQRRRK